MQAYAEQILAARKRLGLSRADAAVQLGVSPRQLARYEQGESPIPLTLAVGLADALGVSLDALIERETPLNLAVELNGQRFTLAGVDQPPADVRAPMPGWQAEIVQALAAVEVAPAEVRQPGRRRRNRPSTA